MTVEPSTTRAGTFVLPFSNRMTAATDFARAVRGRRASAATVVAHLGLVEGSVRQPQVGLIVSKSVGNAVVRNRVSRRLRHLMRERVEGLPAGALLALRATPAAASASGAVLGADLDRVLERLGSQPSLGQNATNRTNTAMVVSS